MLGIQVVWHGDDRRRHVEYVETTDPCEAVAETLRRHPTARSARPIGGYAIR